MRAPAACLTVAKSDVLDAASRFDPPDNGESRDFEDSLPGLTLLGSCRVFALTSSDDLVRRPPASLSSSSTSSVQLSAMKNTPPLSFLSVSFVLPSHHPLERLFCTELFPNGVSAFARLGTVTKNHRTMTASQPSPTPTPSPTLWGQ